MIDYDEPPYDCIGCFEDWAIPGEDLCGDCLATMERENAAEDLGAHATWVESRQPTKEE